MAEPDHTALARPSEPHAAPLTYLSNVSPSSVAKGEQTPRGMHSAFAEVEEVRCVVKLLLDDSDAFREVLSPTALARPPSWPLPAASYAGLLVANHLLAPRADIHRNDSNG